MDWGRVSIEWTNVSVRGEHKDIDALGALCNGSTMLKKKKGRHDTTQIDHHKSNGVIVKQR